MRITCKSASEYIVRKEEGKISFKQRIQLFIHLIECSLCKRFSKQNKPINLLLKKEVTTPETLTADQKSSIIRKMEEAEQDNKEA